MRGVSLKQDTGIFLWSEGSQYKSCQEVRATSAGLVKLEDWTRTQGMAISYGSSTPRRDSKQDPLSTQRRALQQEKLPLLSEHCHKALNGTPVGFCL